MNDVTEWLDEEAWADIEKMRQPKPMPPAEKKKTVTRYKDMTPEKAEHKRKLKKKWKQLRKNSFRLRKKKKKQLQRVKQTAYPAIF